MSSYAKYSPVSGGGGGGSVIPTYPLVNPSYTGTFGTPLTASRIMATSTTSNLAVLPVSYTQSAATLALLNVDVSTGINTATGWTITGASKLTGANGGGGLVTIRAGAGGSSSGSGGTLNLIGGNGTIGAGGVVNITGGGNLSASAGIAGGVVINGGSNLAGSTSAGGSVVIAGGQSPAGTDGSVQFRTPANVTVAIMPTAIGAKDSAMLNDGAQQLSYARVNRTLKTDVSTTSSVGTGVSNLTSYTIPAGTLSADGDSITLFLRGTFVSEALAMASVRISIGGTSVIESTTVDLGMLSIFAYAGWGASISIIRSSATTGRVLSINTGVLGDIVGPNVQQEILDTNSGGGPDNILNLNPTLTWANALTIQCAANLTVGSTNGLVKQDILKVTFEPTN